MWRVDVVMYVLMSRHHIAKSHRNITSPDRHITSQHPLHRDITSPHHHIIKSPHVFGRGDWIRTSDLLHPKQAR